MIKSIRTWTHEHNQLIILSLFGCRQSLEFYNYFYIRTVFTFMQAFIDKCLIDVNGYLFKQKHRCTNVMFIFAQKFVGKYSIQTSFIRTGRFSVRVISQYLRAINSIEMIFLLNFIVWKINEKIRSHSKRTKRRVTSIF